ncbi:MAG: hypothetical protein MKZ58_06530, partial [Candidatus Poseidoniaceae archaeon]|nr:hypothetical protein [Candidatus Poseidoniaceae archaeon]
SVVSVCSAEVDVTAERCRGLIVLTRSLAAALSAACRIFLRWVSRCSIPACTASEPTLSNYHNLSIINSRVRL